MSSSKSKNKSIKKENKKDYEEKVKDINENSTDTNIKSSGLDDLKIILGVDKDSISSSNIIDEDSISSCNINHTTSCHNTSCSNIVNNKIYLVIAFVFCLIFMYFSTIVTVAGIWATDIGRETLTPYTLFQRSKLVAVPMKDRSIKWSLKSLNLKLMFELPSFSVGYNFDRASSFLSSEREGNGDAVGFRDGFIKFNYSFVSEMLSNPNQPRGVYLGASEVPSRCMAEDTLIFTSTGPVHTQIRTFLIDNVPSFKNSDPYDTIEDLDFGEDADLIKNLRDNDSRIEELVLRALVRTLYMTMFEEKIEKHVLDAFIKYKTYGGTCVLGSDFHYMTGNFALREVEKLRNIIRSAIAKSPGGIKLLNKAIEAAAIGSLPNETEEQRSGMNIIRQVADGVAFAGMLGTSHLAINALHRIRSDPDAYLPLFNNDPVGFLHEEARVNPPVTSVTSILSEDSNITLAKVGSVFFPKDTPFQVAISTANTDLHIFGGKFHSYKHATSFIPSRNHDDILSWNGKLKDVKKFQAPRGCPGYKLSMLLAKSVVKAFLPSTSDIPIPLDPTSTGGRAQLADAMVPKRSSLIRVEDNELNIFNKIGFFFWLLLCIGSIGFMWGKQKIGMISGRYMLYLFSQSLVSVGFITNNNYLKIQFQLLASVAYYQIYIITNFYSKSRMGFYLSLFNIMVYLYLAFGFTFVFIMFGYVEIMQAVSSFFYGINASFGMICIYNYYKLCKKKHENLPTEETKEALNISFYGVIGGLFGIFDLIFVVTDLMFGHFFSRVFDSLFYVPLVIPTILSLDERYFNDDNIRRVVPSKKFTKIIMKFILFITPVVFFIFMKLYNTLTSNDICQWEAIKPTDYSICTSSPMSNVDTYGKIMYSLIKFNINLSPDLVELVENPLSIKIPKYDAVSKTIECVKDSGLEIPTYDEDAEDDGILKPIVKEFLFEKLLSNSAIFPIHDSPDGWHDLKSASEVMKIAGGDFLPQSVIDWSTIDVTSDEAISIMSFSGICASRLRLLSDNETKKQESCSENSKICENVKYFVSFDELVNLDVRSGFEKYGAIAYFNSEQKLVKIYWSMHKKTVYPDEHLWEHAKWVFRSSALVGVTVYEHLLQTHLLVSNTGSKSSRTALAKDHPMRRLLKPFNHMTPTINVGAHQFLTTENSLLHRTTSLTYKGLSHAFFLSLNSARSYNNPFFEQMDIINELGDNFPYGQDGHAFFEVVNNFVRSYFNVYYPTVEIIHNDAIIAAYWKELRSFNPSVLPIFLDTTKEGFISITSTYIFFVTGFHHVVGNVAEYLIYPNFAGPRIRANCEVSDVESSYYGLLVAILTGAKAPKLMNNFEHLLLIDQHYEKTVKIFRDFQTNLTSLATLIDERNERREHKFYGFHPKRLLSSVSI